MSYSHFIGIGQPGTVVANHDGPNWNRRANYYRKGKRGYMHVAHLRRAAKRVTGKERRQKGRREVEEQWSEMFA